MIFNPVMSLFWLNHPTYQNFFSPGNPSAITFPFHITQHSQGVGAAPMLIRSACGSVATHGAQKEWGTETASLLLRWDTIKSVELSHC